MSYTGSSHAKWWLEKENLRNRQRVDLRKLRLSRIEPMHPPQHSKLEVFLSEGSRSLKTPSFDGSISSDILGRFKTGMVISQTVTKSAVFRGKSA